MNDKQAIPTIYKGVRMKSRMHADVAFLLDRLGWKWNYEPQSFLLKHGYPYVPAFHVDRWRLWIDAIDHEPDEEEEAHLQGFAHHIAELPIDYPLDVFWVMKPAGNALACANHHGEEALNPGGYFSYCFHCKQWVFQEGPDEKGACWCPECLPDQGQISRWFWLEGRQGIIYVCTDKRSWLLQEWVANFSEQHDRWEQTRRAIACAYCSVMFDLKEPGANVIILEPGAPLPSTWMTVIHEDITDFYCDPICAAAALLTTIVNGRLKQDSASPVARHLDAYDEVQNMLYDLGPGARQNQG